MKEGFYTDAVLREFLLGKVDEAERARIEDLLLTDPDLRDRVFAIEQDLIEDYLENSLIEDDKEKFLSLYAQTAEQQRTLRITKAIKDWAVMEASAPRATPAEVSFWSRFWTWLRLNPRFVVPIAVTIVIAIVIAIVWLNTRTAQQRHLAIELELAQLNSLTSRGETLPQMTSFDLRPVSVRSIETKNELRIPANTRFIELYLLWIRADRYALYQAEVLRIEGSESFTIRELEGDRDGRNTIRLRLPAEFLTRGDYRINLTGVSSDGSAGVSEEYTFAVVE